MNSGQQSIRVKQLDITQVLATILSTKKLIDREKGLPGVVSYEEETTRCVPQIQSLIQSQTQLKKASSLQITFESHLELRL
jgi:hypothetical protein